MKGDADSGALGAKTARACDSCLRRRARWFCGADDAFLCHGCDTLVHSANQLASRHERVRLQTASAKVTTAQAWHSGFTRKARTPRHHNKNLLLQQKQQRLKEKVLFNTSVFLPLVPEIGGEEEHEPALVVDDHEAEEEEEEQLMCRVPVFDVDPFDLETCNLKNDAADFEEMCDLDSFVEFDVDLAEFAANVESLLGVHENSTTQVFDYKQENNEMDASKNEMLKVKDEELDDLESVFDMTSDEVFQWNIDCNNETVAQEEKECVVGSFDAKEETKRERFLRLNYEDVISAWNIQGSPSPWTTGNPPKFISHDDCWQNFLVRTSIFSNKNMKTTYNSISLTC